MTKEKNICLLDKSKLYLPSWQRYFWAQMPWLRAGFKGYGKEKLQLQNEGKWSGKPGHMDSTSSCISRAGGTDRIFRMFALEGNLVVAAEETVGYVLFGYLTDDGFLQFDEVRDLSIISAPFTLKLSADGKKLSGQTHFLYGGSECLDLEKDNEVIIQ